MFRQLIGNEEGIGKLPCQHCHRQNDWPDVRSKESLINKVT
jgi:hypothetical protein